MSELAISSRSTFAQFQDEFGALLARDSGTASGALERALQVHRNTAARAAIDALAANFPVVEALLGSEMFEALGREHVLASPPSDPQLCFYGGDLGSFLARHPALADLAYVAEVAALEQLVIESLFAADARPADGAALAQQLDLERPLKLHPALRWQRFESPAASIWLAHQPGTDASLDQIDWAPELALVTRPAGAVEVRMVPGPAEAFLDASAAGRPLGAAAALVAGDVAPLFAELVEAGSFLSPNEGIAL